jgi:hypothetical protein
LVCSSGCFFVDVVFVVAGLAAFFVDIEVFVGVAMKADTDLHDDDDEDDVDGEEYGVDDGGGGDDVDDDDGDSYGGEDEVENDECYDDAAADDDDDDVDDDGGIGWFFDDDNDDAQDEHLTGLVWAVGRAAAGMALARDMREGKKGGEVQACYGDSSLGSRSSSCWNGACK